MHCPTVVATAAAIAIASSGVAIAQDSATSTVLSEAQTLRSSLTQSSDSPVTAQATPVVEDLLEDSVTKSQLTTESLSENTIHSSTAAAVEPASKTSIHSRESSAAALDGTLAADASSMNSNCPLKTEMLAFTPDQVAQANATGACPRPAIVEPLIIPEPYRAEASPALSIYIPVGYGLDGWSVWGSGDFQAGVREDTGSVGGGGVGVGLGDAKKYVGLELGYTFIDSDSFGEGGFSGKLHRRLPGDISVAFGWNGFANIGRNDFEHSLYGVATKIFRLNDSLDKPFSRLSLTVGGGNGQFRSNTDRDQFENGANIFGNVALRVVRPVSVIAEWTGQDLALGLSIAPFKNLPFVITPAFRDITGSGYEPRFVLGAGVSFKF